MLGGEFCLVNGELSNLQYLMNTLLSKSTLLLNDQDLQYAFECFINKTVVRT